MPVNERDYFIPRRTVLTGAGVGIGAGLISNLTSTAGDTHPPRRLGHSTYKFEEDHVFDRAAPLSSLDKFSKTVPRKGAAD